MRRARERGRVGRGRKDLIIQLLCFVKRTYNRLAAAAHQQETRLERVVEIKQKNVFFGKKIIPSVYVCRNKIPPLQLALPSSLVIDQDFNMSVLVDFRIAEYLL